MKAARDHAEHSLPTDMAGLTGHHLPLAIHDEIGYENTMEVVDALTAIPRRSADQVEYLETLTILVEAYEEEAHAIDTADLTGPEMLKHLMEENGMTGVEVSRVLGIGPSAVSMILAGKRQMSPAGMRKLAKRFGVDAGLFL